MARVIKQGKCSFSSIDIQTSETLENRDDLVGSEGFNKLFDFFPQSEKEEGRNHRTVGASSKESIKKDQPEYKRKEAEKLIKDAKVEAQKIIEAAKKEASLLKQEAEAIVRQAKKDAEEIESTAYAIGYEQGQKDGIEIGRKQFEIGVQHLENFLKEFKEQTRGLANHYEAQMLHVTVAVAKKVLEKEVLEDESLIGRILKSALEKVIEGSSISVHMNPRDFENLTEDFINSLSSPGGNKIKIKTDNSIKRGGCMIETEFGFIDANLDSRWLGIIEEIEKILKEKTGFSLNKDIKNIDVREESISNE